MPESMKITTIPAAVEAARDLCSDLPADVRVIAAVVQIDGEIGALVQWSNGLLQARFPDRWLDLDQHDAHMRLEQSRRAAGKPRKQGTLALRNRRRGAHKARLKRFPWLDHEDHDQRNSDPNDPRR